MARRRRRGPRRRRRPAVLRENDSQCYFQRVVARYVDSQRVIDVITSHSDVWVFILNSLLSVTMSLNEITGQSKNIEATFGGTFIDESEFRIKDLPSRASRSCFFL